MGFMHPLHQLAGFQACGIDIFPQFGPNFSRELFYFFRQNLSRMALDGLHVSFELRDDRPSERERT